MSGSNVLCRFEYNRLRLEESFSCAYLLQLTGQGISPDAFLLVGTSGEEQLGSMLVEGWYCEAGTGKLSDEKAQAFVAGVGVRHWATL